MANGRHVAHGLASPGQDEARVGLADPARAEPPREPLQMDPVRSAGHDQGRLAVGLKHQAVRDRPVSQPRAAAAAAAVGTGSASTVMSSAVPTALSTRWTTQTVGEFTPNDVRPSLPDGKLGLERAGCPHNPVSARTGPGSAFMIRGALARELPHAAEGTERTATGPCGATTAVRARGRGIRARSLATTVTGGATRRARQHPAGGGDKGKSVLFGSDHDEPGHCTARVPGVTDPCKPKWPAVRQTAVGEERELPRINVSAAYAQR